MRLKRRFEAGGECLYVIDHRPQRPESIVRVLLPIDALCVEEDTGTRTIQILRDLTADVAQIEIGRAGVAHVDRAFTAKVDMHMRQLAVPLELRIALRCGRVEQTHMRRKDQVVAIARSEEHTSELQSLMRI